MSAPDESLAGFDRIEQDGRIALVRHDYADAMANLLFGAGLAHEVTRQSGRGSVYTFDLPDGKGILRPYRRGGALARFREDRYWRSNRPLKELVILDHAYRHELPVPQPLGALWEQQGRSYSGAIATRLLPGVTLQDWAGDHTAAEEAAVLNHCGRVIRAMHDAGIYHADLQIRNVIVGEDGVYLIDFDKASRFDPSTDLPRARNLLRLRRSIEKNRLPTRYFDEILTGYGDIGLPTGLRAGYRIKSVLSDLIRSNRK